MVSAGQWGILLLLIVGGAGLTAQAAINARLREAVGSPVLGAFVSFVVGGLVLGLLSWAGAFGRGHLTAAAAQPWWIWIGGLLGAFYVTLAIVGVPKVGAGAVVAAAVFGQLLAGLAMDSLGWLGVPRVPLSPARVLGAVLLLAGVLLIQGKR